MQKQLEILLVDDQPDFVETISFWMKSKGYAVTISHSGAEALKILESKPIDMVFLDVNMPNMNGIETLGCIRETKPDLPVILVTAYPEGIISDQAKKLGISGIFTKDGTFDHLATLMQIALRTHKKLQSP